MAWCSVFGKSAQGPFLKSIIDIVLNRTVNPSSSNKLKYHQKNMKQIVGLFKSYLSVVGYSIGVQRMLPACVQEFINYSQIVDMALVTPVDIVSFYEWLHTRPLKYREGALSNAMIGHYVYALRMLFDWLEACGQLVENPISVLRLKRYESNSRKPLSVAEIQSLFAAAESLKEQVVLHLFYSCGLRRSEGEQLRLSDIVIAGQVLYVRRGKNSRRRAIPLTEKVAAVFDRYISKERYRVRYRGSSFMLNSINKPMKGDSYLRILRKLLVRAELNSEISLHHLRHSIATHLLHAGAGLEYVRDFLAHRRLESSQIYAKAATTQLPEL
jgi:site-specific recombinase XerD